GHALVEGHGGEVARQRLRVGVGIGAGTALLPVSVPSQGVGQDAAHLPEILPDAGPHALPGVVAAIPRWITARLQRRQAVDAHPPPGGFHGGAVAAAAVGAVHVGAEQAALTVVHGIGAGARRTNAADVAVVGGGVAFAMAGGHQQPVVAVARGQRHRGGMAAVGAVVPRLYGPSDGRAIAQVVAGLARFQYHRATER